MCIPEELIPDDLLSYENEKEDNQTTSTNNNSYNPPDNYDADSSDPFWLEPLDVI